MPTAPETREYKLVGLAIAIANTVIGAMIARNLFYPGWMYYAVIAFAIVAGTTAGISIARRWEQESAAAPLAPSDRWKRNLRRALPYVALFAIALWGTGDAMRGS